jgi:hypothetical protein
MLGKNPLATTPLATLAGGTQDISIPASLIVTGSAGGISLIYEISTNTPVSSGSTGDLSLLLNVSPDTPVVSGSTGDISFIYEVKTNTPVITGSAGSLSLIYEIRTVTANATAFAFAPSLGTGAQDINIPASTVATGSAGNLSLIYEVALDASGSSSTALAGQVDLQAFVVTQVASAEASTVDPDITPVPTVVIDPATAQATATNPVLLANIVIDESDVASALAENISLIPSLELDAASVGASAPNLSLINNLSLSTAQIATALAESLTLNLSVEIDSAALSTVTSHDLQIIPGVFIATANALAIEQDVGLSGSIFLQYAPAIAITGQTTLQYSASLGVAHSQATVIDPTIQLQVDLNSTSVVSSSATTPDLSLSIVVNPALAQAITLDPLLVYNLQLSSSITTATAIDAELQLGVILDHAPSNASVGAIDLIPFVSIEPARATANAVSPSLVYTLLLQTSTTATATAIDPALQLSVVIDHVTSIATTGDVSLTPFISLEPAIATAPVISPSLIYNIITPVTVATASAHDPTLLRSIVIGPSTIASAIAGSLSTYVSVVPATTISYANAIGPGLQYFLNTSPAFASSQTVDPFLQLSVVADAPTIATASAIQPSLFASVRLLSADAESIAIDPSYSFEVVPVVAEAAALSIDPHLEYNIIQTTSAIALALSGALVVSRTAGDYYIDPVNGNDANDGLSWDTPWRTMTFGATQPRLIPGDFIKLAKTSDPVSIGCLWTSGSKAVVMGSPRTLWIDDCEVGWTAVSGSTTTHVTSTKKHGNASVKIDVSSFSSSSLYAYKQIPATDYSAYQEVSLWYRTATGSIDSGRWNLCLCSDTSGEVIVDQFPLPAHPAPDRWMPIVVAKTGGGNLASSVRSVALYTTNTPPTSSHGVMFDNIQATAADDLNLTSLVSKNSSSVGGLEGYWAIQSISGSTILLDRDTNCDASSGYGYYGVTEDVTTYIRNTYKTPPASSLFSPTIFNVNQSGSYLAPVIYTGGWNTGSNIQDGETYYDGQNGLGVGFYLNGYSFISASKMSFFRYGVGLYVEGESAGHNIGMSNLSNNSNAGAMILDRTRLSNFEFGNVNSNGSIELTGSCGVTFKEGPMDNVVTVRRAFSNHDVGVLLDSTNNIRFLGTSSIANNPRGLRAIDCGAGVFVEDTTFKNISVDTSNDSSRITLVNASMVGSNAVHFEHLAKYGYTQKTLSHNHDSTGTNLVSHGGGLITSMATTRPGGSGLMWQLLTSATHRDVFDPLPLYVGQVYCVANATTVVKAWLRKDHATQVNGRLAARGRQLAGIPNNVTATLANNTGWQELSISLTPTESGVVQIEVWAEYVSGHQPVYYDQGLTVV